MHVLGIPISGKTSKPSVAVTQFLKSSEATALPITSETPLTGWFLYSAYIYNSQFTPYTIFSSHQFTSYIISNSHKIRNDRSHYIISSSIPSSHHIYNPVHAIYNIQFTSHLLYLTIRLWAWTFYEVIVNDKNKLVFVISSKNEE